MIEGHSGTDDTLQPREVCADRFRMFHEKTLLDKWPIGCLWRFCLSGLGELEVPASRCHLRTS